MFVYLRQEGRMKSQDKVANKSLKIWQSLNIWKRA